MQMDNSSSWMIYQFIMMFLNGSLEASLLTIKNDL